MLFLKSMSELTSGEHQGSTLIAVSLFVGEVSSAGQPVQIYLLSHTYMCRAVASSLSAQHGEGSFRVDLPTSTMS